MKRASSIRGMTLIELIVVCIIISIMAAYGVPQYMKSVETTKADDATALLQMVGTTAKMFALDHGGNYPVGTLTSSCSSATASAAAPYNACDLVADGYLASQDFDTKPYVVVLVAPAAANSCTAGGAPAASVAGVSIIACTGRQTTGTAATSWTPYTTWGYYIDTNGSLNANAGSTSVPAPVK